MSMNSSNMKAFIDEEEGPVFSYCREEIWIDLDNDFAILL